MTKIVQKFKVGEKEIVFRYPEAKDAQDIVALVSSFVEEKAMVGGNKKPTLKEIKATLLKRLKQIKNKEVVYLVVEVDKKVKGRSWISKKELDIQNHVGNLVIHLSKELRGKGLGDRLLKAIIKEAKKTLKTKIITLEVIAENKLAINLYEKNGFIKNGEIKKGIKHFGKLLDEILMIKYL
jgi:RimJ/RimL family protein N-acetyltransferase